MRGNRSAVKTFLWFTGPRFSGLFKHAVELLVENAAARSSRLVSVRESMNSPREHSSPSRAMLHQKRALTTPHLETTVVRVDG